jgi:type II secretory pathway component PulL
VIAIARARIEALNLELKRYGIQPQLVTAEYFTLPLAADGWSVAVEQDMATIRPHRHAGIKVALSDLEALVPLLRREYPAVSRVAIYSDGAPQAFPQAAFADLRLEWRPALNAGDMLAELAAQSPPVLLDASITTQRRDQAVRLWRVVAAVAIAAMLIYPALLGWQHGALAGKERELLAANGALFSAAFPGITRVVNPRVQADQALAELRARAVAAPRFLDLLARVDAVRAQRFPPGTRIANAAFAGGAMELGIETAGMDGVELVRSALKEAGLAADTLSAESSGAAIVARLRVKEGT